jgi:hypothetical protein
VDADEVVLYRLGESLRLTAFSSPAKGVLAGAVKG